METVLTAYLALEKRCEASRGETSYPHYLEKKAWFEEFIAGIERGRYAVFYTVCDLKTRYSIEGSKKYPQFLIRTADLERIPGLKALARRKCGDEGAIYPEFGMGYYDNNVEVPIFRTDLHELGMEGIVHEPITSKEELLAWLDRNGLTNTSVFHVNQATSATSKSTVQQYIITAS